MIDSASWINLPVGYNLVDHVNVRILSTDSASRVLTPFLVHRQTSLSLIQTSFSMTSTRLGPSLTLQTALPIFVSRSKVDLAEAY